MNLGFRYIHGKILIFKDNPGSSTPAWAIDIREILAMVFVGIAAIFLIYQGETDKAMYLLGPMLGYAIGRTIPGTLQKKTTE